MNEQNLDYLKNSLNYLGFGTKLNEVLEAAIRKEVPKFSLSVLQRFTPNEHKTQVDKGTDHIHVKLNFNKAKENDTYFLNDYTATLSRHSEPLSFAHTFDLERDHRVTLNQVYSLLLGNAILKEIYARPKELESSEGDRAEKIKIWMRLQKDITDAYGNHPLRRFYPEYNFNLAATLDKYPLAKLSQLEREGALKMMEMGIMPKVAMTVDKRVIPVFISANPQMKSLEVFNEQMLPIREELIFPEKSRDRKNASAQIDNGSLELGTEETEERMPWEQEKNAEKSQQIGR